MVIIILYVFLSFIAVFLFFWGLVTFRNVFFMAQERFAVKIAVVVYSCIVLTAGTMILNFTLPKLIF